MEHESVLIWVYGRVQGVGFRYNTQRQACALKLSGYVRNLDDGSVEIWACGPRENVRRLIDWAKAGGPGGAKVDKVVCEPYLSKKMPEGFHIKH